MFKLRSHTKGANWRGVWGGVCVCITPVQKEPWNQALRWDEGLGLENVVWLRGASSCREALLGKEV